MHSDLNPASAPEQEMLLPLSLQQHGMWSWCQMHPSFTGYNYSSCLRFRGELALRCLEQAVDALLRRQESLRASFPVIEGEPVQRLASRPALRLPLADLSALLPAAREDEIHRLHRRLGLQPYDLQVGPLVRFLLIRADSHEHDLLAGFHHLVLDGPCFRTFCQELFGLYVARRGGHAEPEAPGRRFRDFLAWQVEALRTGSLARDEAHWLERFAPPLPSLELPTDRPRKGRRSFRGRRVEVPLGPDQLSLLAELCARLGASPLRVCLTAFKVLLHRLSGQNDLIVGVPATSAPPEFGAVLGCFVGTLPVRTRIEGGMSFAECVDGVRARLREAYEHRLYPFEAAVGRLGLPRDLNQLPVYSVACTQVVPVPRMTGGGVVLEAREEILDWAFFDLNLSVRGDGGELQLELHYDLDLFDAETAAAMAESLATLIEVACFDPHRPIERLELLSPARRTRLELRPRPRQRFYPLAFNQRDLWSQYMLLPPNPYYNCSFAATVEAPLDTTVLRRAVVDVLARHEILSATFHQHRGRPAMRVEPHRVDCPTLDLSELDPGPQATRLVELTEEMALEPFDLELGPLTRQLVVRLAEGRHRLILVIHHLLNDQPAQGELLREIAERAVRLQRGEDGPPPPLTVQYQDFAIWQDDRLRAGALAGHRSYWLRELEEPLPTLEPPSDFARPPIQTFRGAYLIRRLPDDLLRRLQELRRARDVSLFRLLLACFALLAGRWCGRREVILAVPVSTRPREIAEVNGYFSLAVPIRVDLRGDPRLDELLERVHAKLRGAVEHAGFPLVEIYRRLAREPGRPLFPICVSQTRPLDTEGEGWALRQGYHDTPGVVFDLWVLFEQSADSLEVKLKYNTDLFEPASIERLWLCFAELLRSVLRRPDAKISRLGFVPGTELRRVGEIGRGPGDAADTAVGGSSLWERVSALAAQRPDSVAVVAGGSNLSYGALIAAARRLARGLGERGIGLECPVAVLTERGLGLVELLLGLDAAGAVYVPLEPGNPDLRLHAILDDCGARLLVAGPWHRHRALALAAGLERPVEIAALGELTAATEGIEPAAVGPQALANVFYTSGSTGRPKGAMVTRGGMLNHLLAKVELLRLNDAAVVAQNASIGFDISIWQLLAPLLAGGRTVIYDDATATAAGALLERIERDGVTVLETVPSLLELMLSEVPAAVRLPALQALISNAETLPVPLARRWSRRFPHVPLLNTYGATECSDDVTHQVFHRPPPAQAQRVGVGTPITGMRVEVVDPTSLEPLPVGWPGPIVFAGVGVGRGYLGDPRKTALAFVPDPRSRTAGGRLYRTGDLGRFTAAGHLEFLGRADHQVKVRGHRVELGEVEAALLRLDGVRQAAAVVRPDAQGRHRLVVYVVADGGGGGDLRGRLQEHLPPSMLPDSIVELAALPLTANGKIDRAALPEPPEERRTERVPPRSALERRLAEAWREVLGTGEFGVEDDFFALGGDSIQSIRLSTRLRREGVALEPRLLFQHPTIAALARELEATDAEPAAPPDTTPPTSATPSADELAAIRSLHGDHGVGDVFPLSPIQEGMLFHTLLEPDRSPYQEQVASRLLGPLDPAAFVYALEELIRRHPMLRTVFWDGSRRLQAVLERIDAHPLVLDLRALAPERREVARRRAEKALFRRPLMPTERPPVQFTLILLDDRESALVWTFNHVLLDGWSSGLLLTDLMAVYGDLRRHRPAAPAAHPPYRDYVRWLAAQDADAAREFWRRQLAGLERPTPLPAERRPTQLARSGRRQAVRAIDLRTVHGLERFGRTRRVAPSFVWQAAWAALLARSCGAEETVFGLVLLGRPEVLDGADRIVGPFITTVPLRIAVPPDATPDQVVRGLMARYPELSRHAHLPLPEIQSLSGIRPPRRLFESLLDIQRGPGGSPRSAELYLVHDEARGGRGGTSYDLAIDVVGGDRPLLRAHYAPEVFDAAEVERLLESLEGWALALTEAPDSPLVEIGPGSRRKVEVGLADLERGVLEELGAELD